MSPAARDALARSIFEQARELSERVSKVLQMTRLETGAIRIERDWTPIPDLVDSAVRRLSERLAAHRLVVDLPDDLPLVRVDAALVEQALGNLLENAAKHTPPGTVVRVRAAVGEARMIVSVVDSGGEAAGIDLDRMFRKFQHGAIEGTAGGVGLGLAICRAIMTLHGGDCRAERTADRGMAFTITLPLERPPAPPVEASPALHDDAPADDPRR